MFKNKAAQLKRNWWQGNSSLEYKWLKYLTQQSLFEGIDKLKKGSQ